MNYLIGVIFLIYDNVPFSTISFKFDKVFAVIMTCRKNSDFAS